MVFLPATYVSTRPRVRRVTPSHAPGVTYLPAHMPLPPARLLAAPQIDGLLPARVSNLLAGQQVIFSRAGKNARAEEILAEIDSMRTIEEMDAELMEIVERMYERTYGRSH
jgi:hypothetical protein